MTLLDAKNLIQGMLIIPMDNINCKVDSLDYNKFAIYTELGFRRFTVYVRRPIPFINTFIIEFYAGICYSRRTESPVEVKIDPYNHITILSRTANMIPTTHFLKKKEKIQPLTPQIKLNLKQ